jgi:hypothetical protein
VACRVGDQVVSPELLVDRSGLPSPSDLRLSFWTLQPMPSFSPFSALSVYPESEPAVTDADPVVDVEPAGRSDDRPTDEPGSAERRDRPADLPVDRPADVPKDRPTDVPKERPADVPKERPADVPKERPADLPKERPVDLPEDPSPGVAASCDDLHALEPMAMLGRLSGDQMSCLETRFAKAATQTEKDKVSRVELTQYRAAGDKNAWARAMKRHLHEIDQSDPDLTMAYALHLARSCPSGAEGAIHWADKALEQRFVWTGTAYVDKVYSLYKLRAASAQCLWKAAEDEHAKGPTDATKARAEDTRNRTKVAAREWFEYASEAKRDPAQALALCVSAAGTESYCKSR